MYGEVAGEVCISISNVRSSQSPSRQVNKYVIFFFEMAGFLRRLVVSCFDWLFLGWCWLFLMMRLGLVVSYDEVGAGCFL